MYYQGKSRGRRKGTKQKVHEYPKGIVWDTKIFSEGKEYTLYDYAQNEHLKTLDTIVPMDIHIGMDEHQTPYKTQYLPFIRTKILLKHNYRYSSGTYMPIYTIEVNGTELVGTAKVELLIYGWGFLPLADLTYQHMPVVFNPTSSILRRSKITNIRKFTANGDTMYARLKLHDVDFPFRWPQTYYPGTVLLSSGLVVR